MNIIGTILAIGIIVVSVFFVKDAVFAARSLSIALQNKKYGFTKYNYLRWEMPNNDIENEIEDEIKVNIAFIAGIVLWLLTVIFYPHNLLVLYAAYFIGMMLYFRGMEDRLSVRYSDFYDVFSKQKKREDFSDDLAIYGSRIEGTATKLKKSKLLSILYLVGGVVMMLL